MDGGTATMATSVGPAPDNDSSMRQLSASAGAEDWTDHDWDGLFDDSAANATGKTASRKSGELKQESTEPNATPAPPAEDEKAETREPSTKAASEQQQLKQQQERKLCTGRDGPDHPHRQAVAFEVAWLLQARKKTKPTKEWLERLPEKARMLEQFLYKCSKSPQHYMDRSTLKSRLKRLIRTIRKSFYETKRDRMARLECKPQQLSDAQASSTTAPAGSPSATRPRSSPDSPGSEGVEMLRNNMRRALEIRSSSASNSPVPPSSAAAKSADSMTGVVLQPAADVSGVATGGTALTSLLKPYSAESNALMGAGGLSALAPTNPTTANTFAFAGQSQLGGSLTGMVAGGEQMPNMSLAASAAVGGMPEVHRQTEANSRFMKQVADIIRQQEEIDRQLRSSGYGGLQQQAAAAPGNLPASSSILLGQASALDPAQQAAVAAQQQQAAMANAMAVAGMQQQQPQFSALMGLMQQQQQLQSTGGQILQTTSPMLAGGAMAPQLAANMHRPSTIMMPMGMMSQQQSTLPPAAAVAAAQHGSASSPSATPTTSTERPSSAMDTGGAAATTSAEGGEQAQLPKGNSCTW